ncbi:MAG TPA: complex I NDUFA9 subunit family protein [Gammaproteobacteria bacterium]|nr:complex I NDUFA9 subunit family protein [Gammaproteobacteria bacterium]
MKFRKVALLGGSGFVGRHLTHHLHNAGYECRVLTRHAFRHPELRLSAELREVGDYAVDQVTAALEGCDAAVNLVGILNPQEKGQGFREVHVALTERVVEACRQAGVRRLLHMSALHADQAQGSSEYLRSKGEGENRAHTLGQPDIAVTSFQPSVIFGPDDSFLNRFARLLRIPGPLPLARAGARFAPVYVQDVAEAFVRALPDRHTFGRRYPLCGPEIYTLEEIIRLVAFHTRRHKEIIRLPDALGRLQAAILQFAPGRPFTPDNFLSLQTDSVCERNGLLELGIEPTPMGPLAEEILQQHTRANWFNRLRRWARRDPREIPPPVLFR